MSDTNTGDAHRFLGQAVELARTNIEAGGRPFGAVVVREGEVIATAVNETHLSHDLTDHAELLAIRATMRAYGQEALKGSAVYASGHPCPMCLAAMRLAGVGTVAYACSNEDGAPFGLSTADIYAELRLPFAEQSMAIRHVPVETGSGPHLYEQWAQARGRQKQDHGADFRPLAVARNHCAGGAQSSAVHLRHRSTGLRYFRPGQAWPARCRIADPASHPPDGGAGPDR